MKYLRECREESGRSKAGFTLVEMLVVMAVIGILAAMLLPALAAARERARLTQCLSNMKQLLIATHMYANDNGGFIPQVEDPNPSFLGLFSDNRIWADVDFDGGFQFEGVGRLYPYAKSKKVFYCTNDDGKFAPDASYDFNNLPDEEIYSSYCLRGCLQPDDGTTPNNPDPTLYEEMSRKLDRLTKRPILSCFWLHFPGNSQFVLGFHRYPGGGKYPVGYGDGHAAILPYPKSPLAIDFDNPPPILVDMDAQRDWWCGWDSTGE